MVQVDPNDFAEKYQFLKTQLDKVVDKLTYILIHYEIIGEPRKEIREAGDMLREARATLSGMAF